MKRIRHFELRSDGASRRRRFETDHPEERSSEKRRSEKWSSEKPSSEKYSSEKHSSEKQSSTSRSLRRMVAGFGLAAAGLLAWAVLEPAVGVFFNSTVSLPTGLYVVRDVPVEVGDVVAICPDEETSALALARGYMGAGDCPFGTAPAGKALAAGHGDTVRVTRTGVWIGDHLLPNSAPLRTDRHGYGLPVLRGVYGLESGEVWLYSGHDARSFDSRYFGPVRVSQIRGKVIPIWVRGQAYDPARDVPPGRNTTPKKP